MFSNNNTYSKGFHVHSAYTSFNDLCSDLYCLAKYMILCFVLTIGLMFATRTLPHNENIECVNVTLNMDDCNHSA